MTIEPAYINAMLIATATLTLSDCDFVFMPVYCQTGCPIWHAIKELMKSPVWQAFKRNSKKEDKQV